MKMFNYNVNTYFADGDEMTIRTNNVNEAIQYFFTSLAEGHHTDIVNGCTGEVLVIAADPNGEDFVSDEMALMMVGYMAAEAWGAEEVNPPHDVPADGVVADPIVVMMEDLVTLLGAK